VRPLLSRLARAHAALRHAAANPAVRTAYFVSLAAATTWTVLGTANLLNDFRDAQYCTLWEEAARLAVAKFHQLPLWDPYYCGGITGLGTPSARFVSPTFLLTLVFGTLRGTALTMFVMTCVGLEGAYRYARARGAGALGATMTAPVFGLSGIFAYSTALAWTNFFGFELVPWALVGVRLALAGSRRGIVLAGLAMGWMIGFGGTYTGPLTLLAAIYEVASIVVAGARRSGRGARLARAALMGVTVALLSAGLSMIRLWPVAETLSAAPRIVDGTPGTAPLAVWKLLFGEWGSHFTKADFLIGLPVLPVVLLGIWRKRALAPALGMALSVWFAMGYDVHASIFAVLRTVPPYTMLRAPERFLVFVALTAATVAALGIRRLDVAVRKNARYVLVSFAAYALLLGDAGLLAHLGQAKAKERKLETIPPTVARDFRQSRGNRWIAAYYPGLSLGSLSCFDDYDVPQSTDLRADLAHEEYLRDDDAGTVKRVAWSPSRIDLRVDLSRPARVYVNQNWHPGWRSNVGSVVSDNGLLAVDLPAGTHDLTLRFLSRSAVGGIGTTLLALIAAGALVRRARRGDDVALGKDWLVTACFCGAPLLVIPASFLFVHEPRRPPPPLITPAGEPIVVAAPPDDAKRLGVRWREGPMLEAANVDYHPRDENHGPSAIVELDFRFDRPVPPGLGIFLQFERPRFHFGEDHVLISGALLPEAAPLHATIRDVSDTIAIPEEKTATTWSVYAGFWRARRDMTRLEVEDPGAATVSSNRVLIGTFEVPPP